MITEIKLRPALLSDTPSLLPLLAQLGYPTTEQILERRLETYLTHPEYTVLVACMDHHIVGFIACSCVKLLHLEGQRLHIEVLVIDQNYRGQGIGKRLIHEVEKMGAAVIDLISSTRRAKDGTHDFYQTLGYSSMSKLYFRKEFL